jgi:hypothetical protein
MPVNYSGNTTSFSGNGTVNPQKLFIPGVGSFGDPKLNQALLAIQQYINNLQSAGAFTVISQTYSVSGTLSVPSGATGYLPPFFMPTTGQAVNLFAVIYKVRSGSATMNIQHNGTNIATGLSVTTAATETSLSASVANNDTFQPVLTAVSSADGLSCSFYFNI